MLPALKLPATVATFALNVPMLPVLAVTFVLFTSFALTVPMLPVVAVNVPFTFVKLSANDEAGPGLMSWTRTVPDEVPLLFQSSGPVTPSLPRKKSASTARSTNSPQSPRIPRRRGSGSLGRRWRRTRR